MLLVTGASGNLGSAVIKNLLKHLPAKEIAGLVRDSNRAKVLEDQGVQVHIGDYANKQSLLNAFRDVEKVLLISSNGDRAFEDHKNVVNSAKKAGVKRVYYTSGALNRNVAQSRLGPLLDAYITTENYIKESGLPFTIFQNGLYAETIPYFIGAAPLHTGIYFPAGDGKATFAKREEIGEAIANVLMAKGHEYKTYLTTTAPSYSFAEIANILSGLSGKTVDYFSPEPEAYHSRLKEYGVRDTDIWFSSLFAAIIKNGEYDTAASDLEILLGRKPTDLQTYLQETFYPNL